MFFLPSQLNHGRCIGKHFWHKLVCKICNIFPLAPLKTHKYYNVLKPWTLPIWRSNVKPFFLIADHKNLTVRKAMLPNDRNLYLMLVYIQQMHHEPQCLFKATLEYKLNEGKKEKCINNIWWNAKKRKVSSCTTYNNTHMWWWCMYALFLLSTHSLNYNICI